MKSFSDTMYDRLKAKMASLPVVVPSTKDPITVSDPEKIRFSAVLWSDLHFSGFYLPERAMHCRTAMADLSNAPQALDALIIAGDLAENGKRVEKDYLAEQLIYVPTVRHILPASGNHDSRLRHILHSREKFAQFCSKVNPEIRTDTLYYSYDINGYTVVVLGTAKTSFEECFFDETELSWMKAELSRATKDGKPVFVVLHQPLAKTHNLPHSWDYPGEDRGSVGPQSDLLRGILNSYRNVFLLTGHLHRGFSLNTYEEVGNIHSINIPSTGVWNKDSEYGNAGLGFLMEVYDDRVLFRPRDFITGTFISDYNRNYFLE